MKNSIIYSVIPAIALAFAINTPASAQLLGSGGGLGGGLTGGLGGSIERTTGTATGSSTGSIQGQKQIDRKSGRVSGNGQAQGSTTGTVTGSNAANNGSATGSANASKSGSIDAQLVGTDFVRGTGQEAVGLGRGTVEVVRGTATSAAGSARSAAGNAAGTASGAGSIAGNGSAMGGGMSDDMASGSLGQLVASGSFAASKSGNFAIEPGMPIEDAKGRTIGYVQSVKQTKQGVVEAVTVETGNRMATLPAASFSGEGDALVTGMTKGEMKSVAKQQDAQRTNAAPATSQAGPQDNTANSGKSAGGQRTRESNNVKDN